MQGYRKAERRERVAHVRRQISDESCQKTRQSESKTTNENPEAPSIMPSLKKSKADMQRTLYLISALLSEEALALTAYGLGNTGGVETGRRAPWDGS